MKLFFFPENTHSEVLPIWKPRDVSPELNVEYVEVHKLAYLRISTKSSVI